MRKRHNERWTSRETELFYMGLQLFGTDFTAIARLFNNRDRCVAADCTLVCQMLSVLGLVSSRHRCIVHSIMGLCANILCMPETVKSLRSP